MKQSNWEKIKKASKYGIETPKSKIKLIKGDITTFNGDAIVNAANEALQGGSGVDGAIHAAAGPKLKEACAKFGSIEAGQAVVTPSFDLPSATVIHTVGPRYDTMSPEEAEEKLRACYRNSLQKAVNGNMYSVALPNISCGVFGYPHEDAAKVALDEVRQFLKTSTHPLEVTFVCFEQDNFDIYKKLITGK